MKVILVGIMATFLATAAASAHSVLGIGSGPLVMAKGIGYSDYRLNTVPPLRHCRIGHETVYYVSAADCERIKTLYETATNPYSYCCIDWWGKIQRLDIPEFEKITKGITKKLVTAIAAKRSEDGDFDAAFQVANLLNDEEDALDLDSSVSVLTALAVVDAERRFFLRSSELIEEAYRRCHVANRCGRGRDSEGDYWIATGSQSSIQQATAQIAVIQAEHGNSSWAMKTIRQWDELVGVDLDLRDRTYWLIALEMARQGKLLVSAEFLARIEKKKLRDEAEREVKEIFAELNDT